ncbi:MULTISPECIES: helix-turn-helix domain-containing protein [Bacillaceae]|uniref:helix-turn-helix domain-containing protein n=1 Tax=Bacillaceae TaxID=186817 RepID=UPI000472BDA8|nr:helix-turn-helix domain-containing protein [Heyndrickxia ginsengihumi]
MNNLFIGRLIREMRREREITMVDFAKKINISQPTLSRIESGNQEVSFSLLVKICREFDISLSDFFRRLEGKSELQKLQLPLVDQDSLDIDKELEEKLISMISSLSTEQKKGLYVLLLPFIKD